MRVLISSLLFMNHNRMSHVKLLQCSITFISFFFGVYQEIKKKRYLVKFTVDYIATIC